MDPRVEQLERRYAEIAWERMGDLPIANPALGVEAVGFRQWEGAFVGALVTPWCINLVRLPADPDRPARPGHKHERVFPAGRFEFIEAESVGFGAYEMCSLFSPVMEFLDQEAARTAAGAAVGEVLEPADSEPESQEQAAALSERKVSRRGFLSGAVRGSGS
jgi:[NiFe] hydrogenase assembly HybE family chaperone